MSYMERFWEQTAVEQRAEIRELEDKLAEAHFISGYLQGELKGLGLSNKKVEDIVCEAAKCWRTKYSTF